MRFRGAPVFSGRVIASPLFSSGSRSPARGTKSRPRADGLLKTGSSHAQGVRGGRGRSSCSSEGPRGFIACSRCPRGAGWPWVGVTIFSGTTEHGCFQGRSSDGSLDTPPPSLPQGEEQTLSPPSWGGWEGVSGSARKYCHAPLGRCLKKRAHPPRPSSPRLCAMYLLDSD